MEIICNPLRLTLANSLSVIYNETAPEPGIYYPLLLSVRQHDITLHRSSQFAAAAVAAAAVHHQS